MNARRREGLVVLCLVLAGCSRKEGDGQAGAASDSAAPDTAVVAVAPLPPPGDTAAPAVVVVALAPVGSSGTSGDANLADSAGTAQVVVHVVGAPTGEHAEMIHSGSCDKIGPVVHQLQPVTVAGGGTGTATSSAPVPVMAISDGQHVVVVHGAGGEPIACGPIPAHHG